ncbi:hypothetical protein [Flavobacterium sp.]
MREIEKAPSGRHILMAMRYAIVLLNMSPRWGFINDDEFFL